MSDDPAVAEPLGLYWSRLLPTWVWLLLLTCLPVLIWSWVRAAGGAHAPWTHLFYVPIVLAVLPYGVRGAVAVALAAAVLCGPLMPLDTARGLQQEPMSWLVRGAFFVGGGLVAAAAVAALRRSLQGQVAAPVRHEVADVRLRVPAVTSAETAQRIREALDERSFHPVYQPIYSLRGGRLIAVEALTRFDGDPARSPAWWFEQAERAGMSVALDLAAIEAALDGAEDLPDDVVLHLNATPPTLRDLRFLALLDAHPHRQIAVELTEHAAVEDYQRLGPARRGLRERKVRLVVDDAGAGFSSLRHILRLEPEIIKLDISLTRDIGNDSAHHALARALVLFAEQAGSQLIPEGIENVADLRAWQRLGADAAQGFLLGRPGPLPATDPCPAIPGRAPTLARRRTAATRPVPTRRSGPAAR